MINQYFPSPYWAKILLGNSLEDYFWALILFIVYLIIFRIFHVVILGRLAHTAKTTKGDIDDMVVEVLRTVKPPFYSFLAFYFALEALVFPVFARKVVTAVLLIWIVYQCISVADILIDYIVRKRIYKDHGDKARAATGAISIMAKLSLWSVGLLLVLSNLGVDITALVAGLGVGGIAVALALQNILGDLFSSFAIYFDRPFLIGDFIVFGDKMGVVEKVGIKTTRIRALQGEEIVISNRDLTSAVVQNFKRMQERRIVFKFGVVYGTKPEKLEKIPVIVKKAVESAGNTRFDRAHFFQFGDFSLNYEVVYYVLSPDYNKYMDTNQNIHLGIVKAFASEGIEMAFPTKTVYLKKEL